MKIAVYAVPAGSGFGNKRARYIAQRMARGCRRHGLQVLERERFDGTVEADVAVAYGWVHEPAFTTYKDAGAQFVYWDLGYWDRRPKDNSMDGHHRVGVNDWDTAEAMLRDCPGDRFKRLGIEPQEMQKLGNTIIIAGMSEKAAGTHGFAFGQWERETKERLEGLQYKIVVRPKPNKSAPPQVPIQEALKGVRMLVTHHSNAAIDALIAGVPCYAKKGVGRLASPRELTAEAIDTPYFPSRSERLQLFADIAYAQWRPSEMESGVAWDYIRRVLS